MYVAFAGKLAGGSMVGRIETMVPVSGETKIVAGEIVKSSDSSYIAARVETKTMRGVAESCGGVCAGVG
jgi:hypothetical protein